MDSTSKLLERKKYGTNSCHIQDINGWFLLGIICVIYLLQVFIFNNFVFTNELYYRSLSDQLTFQSIQSLLKNKNHYWWLSYVLNPAILLLQVSFTAVCISIGAVLSEVEFKFKTVFKAALIAELVFIIAQIIYLINISFHLDTVTLQTTANYYPLTALSYFGAQHVVKWLQYPLQTLNVFEVLYMAVIAWLLAKQWKQDFAESLAVVLPSYATGLALWLTLVTFLTLQVS